MGLFSISLCESNPTSFRIKLELDKLNEAKYTKQFRSAVEVLDTEKGKYDMHAAYKFSKTMQLVFARELAERLKGFLKSIKANLPHCQVHKSVL